MATASYSLLRIFTDETAMQGDRFVLELLVEQAKASNLLGLTVLQGRLGYGHSKLVHATRFLGRNNPLVIEIVDEEDRLRGFMAAIEHIPGIGLVTIASVEPLVGARTPSAIPGS